MANLPLAGKSAIVTGGARRIGRAIAIALAQAGANVAITYRSSHPEAEQTRNDLSALGVRALATPCDVRSEASVRDAVSAIAKELGQIDILVNNAGVFASAALESLTLEQWDAVFETNARGPFLVAREALPFLRRAHGSIVNIGSLGATHPWAGHAHYCASKAALHMLTEAMAKSFAPDVNVNCVAPGWIEMPAAEPALSSRAADQAERFAAKTPMGKNGSAGDVAQAVLFFVTGPHFITGQTLTVDGGLGLA